MAHEMKTRKVVEIGKNGREGKGKMGDTPDYRNSNHR